MRTTAEIGKAAATLRERGHLVEVPPLAETEMDCVFRVDGKAYRFHEFLDLAQASAPAS